MSVENTKTRVTHFRDLIAWQKAHQIVLRTYAFTKNFPKEEMFGLTNQMRRAAVSGTSNIAEGFGRNSSKDKNQFYGIAKGSLFELENQYIIAKDVGYISNPEFKEIETKVIEAQKIISGLINSSMNR